MLYSTVSITRILGSTLLVAGLLLGLVRCDLAGPVEQKSLVVEAFLKTGEELPTVTLRHTQPMGEPGNETSRTVDGATVELYLEDSTLGRIPYKPDGAPGHYAPEERGTRVPEGVSWELNAEWQGKTVHAEGTTPPPIRVREVCVEVPEEPVRAVLVDSLRRDSLDIPAEQQYIYPIDVTVNWSVERLPPGADTTYWVRAQLPTATFSSEFIGLFLRPMEVRREDQFAPEGRNDDLRQWNGVYAVPVDSSAENDQLFPPHRMTVALTRGDTAFTSFARSRTDPERREPISNVDGGLGVATAVAVDTAVVDSVGPNSTYCHRPHREEQLVLEEP